QEAGKVYSRPQLVAAIAGAKARHSTLLIAKLARLSRRVAFLFNLKDELAKSGVDVVAADMPEVVRDTLTLGIFATLAQKERELISSRTKAALQALKGRGKKLGNPSGTDTSKPTAASVASRVSSADEWTLANVPVIAGLRKSGMTYAAVADILNRQGIRTRKGCRWTPCAVRRTFLRASALEEQGKPA
ncbi:MAG: recombinase family protein, partial [Mailhella sp.]|nr:recombinase family protein [Mailhella sp.]